MAPKHSRRMPAAGYDALIKEVLEAGRLVDRGSAMTRFVMVTGDLEVTQNLFEVRFIAWDGPLDNGVFQVNALGEAVWLIRTEDEA